MRLTLGNLKDPAITNIAETINISPNDARFVQKVNEAQQRLIQTGEMFYGLFQRIQFCVFDGCLVFPRQVASLESVAICDRPIPLRNRWFEFLETGAGIREGCAGGFCCDSQLIDRGESCTFKDIAGTDKKIRVYTDITESPSSEIILYGYDENGIWIKTLVGGEWLDGERVSMAITPIDSTKFFSSLVGVQKPITKGTVRLYEYDTTLLIQNAIGEYEADETNPSYKRMHLSGVPSSGGQVTAMAKLEFIPARLDTDWILISNWPALKDEIQSILKYDKNLAEEGLFWHQKAMSTLRAETRHYLGHGAVVPMRMQPRALGGAGVCNLI